MSGTAAARTNAPVRSSRARGVPAMTSGNDRESEQHGIPGTHECEQRDPEPDERETADRRGEHRTDDQESPERESRGEHRLARELVEHQRVPLVEKQRRRDGDRDPRSEVPRSGRPADDGARVYECHDRLRKPSVGDVEDTTCEERRDRSPEQERPWEEHVVVEELDVGEEVLVQVATGLEWPGERPDRVRD